MTKLNLPITVQKEAFLQELFGLLNKYDASIDFSVSDSSDTYGLNDEKMIISIKENKILTVSGWGINANDLKKYDNTPSYLNHY
jgi:uncharacterized protein YfaS (alpha-2-macroglobulin family)